MEGLTVMQQATEEFIRTGEATKVTKRYLAAAKGDPEEARKRWLETLQWRADNDINHILEKPQPFFHDIKRYYPHYFHLSSVDGMQVYYELVGKINIKALYKSGLTLEGLVNHAVFTSEYLYTKLRPKDNARTITVLDLAGVTLRSLPGDVMKFIRKANDVIGRHFVERAFRIYLINIPLTFALVWNVIHKFIDPITLEKFRVVRGKKAVLKALNEHIAVENIPEQYGGESKIPLGESPEEISLREYVNELNEESISTAI